MNKDVIVTVKGLDIDSADSEPIEVVTPGTYTKKGDKGFLRFEQIEEGVGITKNIVKFDKKSLELTRHGAMEMFLFFCPGKKTMSDYRTPFGNLLVGINTTDYNVDETEESLSVNIGYELEINHEFLANCNIGIKVQPGKQE